MDSIELIRTLNEGREPGIRPPATQIVDDTVRLRPATTDSLPGGAGGSGPPPTMGACCTDGVCDDTTNQAACELGGGIWHLGQTCSDTPCYPCPPENPPRCISFTWSTDSRSGGEIGVPFAVDDGGHKTCCWSGFSFQGVNLPFDGVYQGLCSGSISSECTDGDTCPGPTLTYIEIHLWQHRTTGDWWMTVSLLTDDPCSFHFGPGHPAPSPPDGVIPDDDGFLVYLGDKTLDFSVPVPFSIDVPQTLGSPCTDTNWHIEGVFDPDACG